MGQWNERVERVRRVVDAEVDLVSVPTHFPKCLISLASSRLGHDPHLHRHVCQFLTRSMLDCRSRNATVLIAAGSAIESWGKRAAELFGVSVLTLAESETACADIAIRRRDATKLSLDAAVLGLADRVDAVHVRRGGIIQRGLRARLRHLNDATTRVAISRDGKCAATDLIAAGAIGWFHQHETNKLTNDAPSQSSETTTALDAPWIRTDGRWLIHCTRACRGAWPHETQRQYQDSLLLGDSSAKHRAPIDALVRIVRTGRLVAGATATSREHPVVCFSALPLEELLQRRCFRPQLGRWDYEPWGIAIADAAAERLGIVPVIYGDQADRSRLSLAEQFRFHPNGRTYDWRQEAEWRSNGSVDLNSLPAEDVRVFAADSPETRQRLSGCRWQVSFLADQGAGSPPKVTRVKKPV